MAWGRLLTRLLGFVSVVSCLVLGVGLPLTRWLELRHLHALKSARSVANSTTPPVRVINSECKCKKRPPCSGAGLGWVLDQHAFIRAMVARNTYHCVGPGSMHELHKTVANKTKEAHEYLCREAQALRQAL